MPAIYDTEGVYPCPACHGARRKIGVVLLAASQEWWCEVGHVVIMDKNGKKYLSVQNPKSPEDWRAGEDWKRTDTIDGQEVTPQARAWWDDPIEKTDQVQRRKGGRRKGGSGWTWYSEPEEEE